MRGERQLYEEIVGITEDYLGPAAQRFVDRQIQNHLQKEPGALTTKDLQKLINWAKLALALLTDDERVKSDYSERLEQLSASRMAF